MPQQNGHRFGKNTFKCIFLTDKFCIWINISPECVPKSLIDNEIITPQCRIICVSEWGQHWFRWWLVAYLAPSHYLNQCWVIVNWNLRNKLQRNLDQNTKLFINENAFEIIICEMAAILSMGRWVNPHWFGLHLSQLCHSCSPLTHICATRHRRAVIDSWYSAI